MVGIYSKFSGCELHIYKTIKNIDVELVKMIMLNVIHSVCYTACIHLFLDLKLYPVRNEIYYNQVWTSNLAVFSHHSSVTWVRVLEELIIIIKLWKFQDQTSNGYWDHIITPTNHFPLITFVDFTSVSNSVQNEVILLFHSSPTILCYEIFRA